MYTLTGLFLLFCFFEFFLWGLEDRLKKQENEGGLSSTVVSRFASQALASAYFSCLPPLWSL